MSSQRLPLQIAPFKLARQAQRLQGAIEMSGMERLAEELIDTNGEINVDLQFGVDEQGTHFARGHMSATVQLTCQRCMNPMSHLIESVVSLGFVSNDDQTGKLPQGYEPLVISDETVALADIVEDELILALPIVAMHEEQGCEPIIEQLHIEAEQIEQTEKKPNPFAVLSDLKLDK